MTDVTVAKKQRWKRRSGSGGWLSQSSLPLRKCFLRPWGPGGTLLLLGPGACGLDVEPGRRSSRTREEKIRLVVPLSTIYYDNADDICKVKSEITCSPGKQKLTQDHTFSMMRSIILHGYWLSTRMTKMHDHLDNLYLSISFLSDPM